MLEKGSPFAVLAATSGSEGITEVRRQEALLKTGALQNAILTSANFAVIATDEKGIIQVFNVGAERSLGYLASEVVNRINPSDIHDPLEVMARAKALSLELATPITPGFEALAFKASRGIEDIYELTYICKDGSRFPAIVSITALRDDFGDIIGYLLIGADNSARKLAEEKLHSAMALAEKANHAKSEFLSRMSHELRTPLGAILGFAQLVESGTPAPTPSQKRSVDQILKAGWYLLELINEILDLALIESGKLSLSLEPTSLADVMLECAAMIEPQAQKRRITVTFPPPGVPYVVKADRTRVKQVLINLLSNAIKYNRDGGRRRRGLHNELAGPHPALGRGRRRGAGPGTARAALPAVQPPRAGGERRGRHGHRAGREQAPGRADGRAHRRGKRRRKGKRVLVRPGPDARTAADRRALPSPRPLPGCRLSPGDSGIPCSISRTTRPT